MLEEDVQKDSQEEVIKSVQEEVTAQLPLYMHPAVYVIADFIPLSPAGKVDKRKLKELFQDTIHDQSNQDEGSGDGPVGWTKMELIIRDSISALSRVPESQIAKKTTIYQMGLDSISAVQLAASIRKKGFQISATDVMERPTCEALGRLLEASACDSESTQEDFDFVTFENYHKDSILQTYGIGSKIVTNIRPCTPTQAGLLSKFIESDGQLYFNYLQLKVEGQIDITQIFSALNAITRKYTMLRAGFSQINDTVNSFAMIIYEMESSTILHSSTPVSASAKFNAEDWHQSSAQSVLHNMHKPCWRFHIAQEGERFYVHLALHHALYDARSLRFILRDLSNAFLSQPIGNLQSIDKPLSAILKASENRKEAEEFWSEKKATIGVHRFPNLLPLQPGKKIFESSSKQCSLDLSDLQLFCRHENVTIQAVGEAAWARLLSEYVGETNVTFGVVFSGQTILMSENDGMPTISTVPLTIPAHSNNREIIRAAMACNSSAQKYQFTPLADIQRIMGLQGTALFDTIFVLQKPSDHEESGKLLEIVYEKSSADVSYCNPTLFRMLNL